MKGACQATFNGLGHPSLTAVWTTKTFQTNFPFPDTLLLSEDAQSGRDFQYLCSDNIQRQYPKTISKYNIQRQYPKTVKRENFLVMMVNRSLHQDSQATSKKRELKKTFCWNLYQLLGELNQIIIFLRPLKCFMFKSEPIWRRFLIWIRL